MMLIRLSGVIAVLIISIFNASGQLAVSTGWKQNIKTSLNSINKANAIRLDKQGNCYVLGTTWLADSAKDILLVKFNLDGEEEWRRTFDNTDHGDDIPYAMTIDNEGNIWICGTAKLAKGTSDFLVVKFTPDGIPVSTEIFDGRDHLIDVATCIAVDRSGNVYCAGYETTVDSGINMLVTRLGPEGKFRWKKIIATRQMDIANGLVTDDSANVYVTGSVNSAQRASDIILVKYDSTGKEKFREIYDGALTQRDAGQYISMDDSVNIYISGFINHTNNRADIPVLKFTRNGEMIQENLYNGRISDCGATQLRAGREEVIITGGCNDYNISQLSNFVLLFDKGGNQRQVLKAEEDITFLSAEPVSGNSYVFGARLVHPESTLIPYIATYDTLGIISGYSDSTVSGIAHIIACEKDDNNVYFLCDDTGDATGTISVFKYSLTPDLDKRKPLRKIK